MKTAEERQAEREERLRTNIAGPRTGDIPRTAEAPPIRPKGLELSVVDFWPVGESRKSRQLMFSSNQRAC